MTGLAWALAVTLKTIATVEVMGSGDDRAATRLEAAIQADLDSLIACWAAAKPNDEEPLHFLTAVATMNPAKGSIRRWEVRSGTSSADLDACLEARAATWTASPPPQFPDRYRVTIRYAWVDEQGNLATPPKP